MHATEFTAPSIVLPTKLFKSWQLWWQLVHGKLKLCEGRLPIWWPWQLQACVDTLVVQNAQVDLQSQDDVAESACLFAMMTVDSLFVGHVGGHGSCIRFLESYHGSLT